MLLMWHCGEQMSTFLNFGWIENGKNDRKYDTRAQNESPFATNHTKLIDCAFLCASHYIYSFWIDAMPLYCRKNNQLKHVISFWLEQCSFCLFFSFFFSYFIFVLHFVLCWHTPQSTQALPFFFCIHAQRWPFGWMILLHHDHMNRPPNT